MTKTLQEIQLKNRKNILSEKHIDELLFSAGYGKSFKKNKRGYEDFIRKNLTLDKVLLALSVFDYWIEPRMTGILEFSYQNSDGICEQFLIWDLTKSTLEEQSEETQRGICEQWMEQWMEEEND